ncbi:MAG: phosphotransferase [Paenibacillus sp.]|nr:phosphotransferase [Paenibacillus sp.]
MEYNNLINDINRSYQINIEHIELHRDMIGKVYFLQSRDKRYVFKKYRSFKTNDALQTVRILDYLKENSYPAVSVVRTTQNESHIILGYHDDCCAGILYNYVEGAMPDGKIEAESIGKQLGELHNLMEIYPHKLIHRTKTDYIDDYISIMRELDFHSGKTLALVEYGNELWERITKLPRSFCHGDLHTGNMIRSQSGEYVLFDFDDSSGDYPSMDVAYMCDDTNFNHLHESMYDKTMRLYERFSSGYSKVRTLSDNESFAIFDFIAIRHFQIISRIVRCQGLQSVSKEFFDEQYDWLMKWQKLCIKKRRSPLS